MLEAFRVGPVETGEGRFHLYMACVADGVVSAVAASDRAGLAELKRTAAGQPMICEPGLASAGTSLGYRPRPLSDEAAAARATFAIMLHHGASAAPSVIGQIPQAIEVARHFMGAEPWRLVRPEVPIELTLDLGGRQRRRVVSVLGADGIERGVALHEDAAALARFVDLCSDERQDELLRMAHSSLTIDSEPAWVARAVEAAFGAPLVVVACACDTEGPRQVAGEDLSLLAAAMLAVSRLAPGRLTADVSIETPGGGMCRATARIPEGAPVGRRALPAWAETTVRMSGAVPRIVATVPVLPVPDLAATTAGLRALGFTVEKDPELPHATASWPGSALELIDAPSSRGAGCHLVVEPGALETLAAVWQRGGVEVREVDQLGEHILVVEVPGNLTLTFGERPPPSGEPEPPPRRRASRRRR